MAYLLGALQLLILYRLAFEHFYGFISWTPSYQSVSQFVDFFAERAPWLLPDSVVGYFFDLGTVLAAVCVALHLSMLALLRRIGSHLSAAHVARQPAAL